VPGRGLDDVRRPLECARQCANCNGSAAEKVAWINPLGSRETIDIERDPEAGDFDQRRLVACFRVAVEEPANGLDTLWVRRFPAYGAAMDLLL